MLALQEECLGLHWFSQPEVIGTSLPGTVTLKGWGCISTAEISLLIFNFHMWVRDLPIQHLYPSYQSLHGCFCISLVTGLLFSETSSGSQWWLSCNLVVLLMWSWKEASIVFVLYIVLNLTLRNVNYHGLWANYCPVISHKVINRLLEFFNVALEDVLLILFSIKRSLSKFPESVLVGNDSWYFLSKRIECSLQFFCQW